MELLRLNTLFKNLEGNMFRRGSEWRVWDLHIHTPASYEWRGEKFNGDKEHDDQLIDQMIEHLNNSEPDAFALMDYFTFDGWFKLKKRLSEEGAPKLTKKVFPGIELRVCAPRIRLNVHAIFSDEVRDQDLKDFLAEQEIEENNKKLSEDNLIHFIRNTGEDLLRRKHIDIDKIKNDDKYALEKACGLASLKRENYISSIEKFHDCIAFMPWDTYNGLKEIDVLENYSFVMSLFKKSTIMESRKEEYRNLFLMKETNDNKNIIEQFKKALDYIPRLVVAGSDAHKFSDYGKFPSNKKTWIKADTTFKGLLQAIKEPENRSFIGEVPVKYIEKQGRGAYFLDKIKINKHVNAKCHQNWLDSTEINFNHDLVAIIGKKGSGKSALADVISLLGNSKSSSNYFSFLKDGRFKGKGGFATEFEATITWLNGKQETKSLDSKIDQESIEKVRYIPQVYFEKLCNPDNENNEFQNELNSVIFSYLSDDEKQGFIDLESLIKEKEYSLNDSVLHFKNELNKINDEIAQLELRAQPSVRKLLESKKIEKIQEIQDHELIKPDEVMSPSDTLTPEQLVLKEQLEENNLKSINLSNNILDLNKLIKDNRSKILIINRIVDEVDYLDKQVELFKDKNNEDLKALSIESETVSLEVNKEPLITLRLKLEAEIAANLKAVELLEVDILSCEKIAKDINGKLSEPYQKYNNYLEVMRAWDNKSKELNGSINYPESLLGIVHQIGELEKIPDQLNEKKSKRKEIGLSLYEILERKKEVRESLYDPVQKSIEINDFINETNKFEFLSKLDFNFDSFQEKLTSLIKQQRFDFTPDNIKNTLEDLSKNEDLETKEGVINFLENLIAKLTEANGTVGISEMLRKNTTSVEVYNFIYGLDFIQSKYSLKFQNVEVEKLSPGQRGALLLIFYLLVDKDKTPIILDQPEENLDNDTVVNSLVPILNEAKKTRQIIMVTHNPNLAIVCDAEQIIYTDFHRENNFSISYKSGSIESSELNKHSVDILEGTLRAFNNRRNKYFTDIKEHN